VRATALVKISSVALSKKKWYSLVDKEYQLGNLEKAYQTDRLTKEPPRVDSGYFEPIL